MSTTHELPADLLCHSRIAAQGADDVWTCAHGSWPSMAAYTAHVRGVNARLKEATGQVFVLRCGGGKLHWMEYHVVNDDRVILIHLAPAPIVGWNIVAIEESQPDSWPDMTAAEIVSWKLCNDVGHYTVCDAAETNRALEGLAGRRAQAV